MDYKEKYEQALKRAKVINPGTADYEVAVKIFPELKKSEDEEIRYYLIEFVKINDGVNIPPYYAKKALAWLEKQGEQKLTLEDAAKAFLEALSDTPYNNTPITEAQIVTKQLLTFLSDPKSYNPNAINEQNPAWSEEDENMLQKALSTIRYALAIPADKEDDPCYAGSSIIAWLKSLKEKIKEE